MECWSRKRDKTKSFLTKWIAANKHKKVFKDIRFDPTKPIIECLEQLFNCAHIVIGDELHTIKNPSVNMHTAFRFISAEAHFVLLMTATPTPWSHEDLVGQLNVIYNPQLNDNVSDLTIEECRQLYMDACLLERRALHLTANAYAKAFPSVFKDKVAIGNA
ncbi:uncharacterized protein CC84DRAFT_1182124 [Paraphaeosphaeria sporulosa]|uniref:SNF2 N-terminal domain-containing protein n=1 Tax=Paraphaeosphaeria sporulosa TaxID=1460663 RepID=A0A177BW09_9PLEO|nr:uncharacterized protein CC84DRAFT_1182124 [Paraphaeosphaeria sporulosa]OAF98519.1 hypothetical protein CC84DRAFT_1182124 [Paraphaeosphaeria sporulosa]